MSLTWTERPAVHPSRDRPGPVLITFHGYGASMDDLVELGPMLHPRLHTVSPNAPVDLRSFGMPGFAWFNLYMKPDGGLAYDEDGAERAIGVAADFVNETCARLGVGHDDCWLLGFSQGAMVCHGLMLSGQVVPAGACCLSGRLVERLFTDELDASHLANVPIFISHGRFDDVIPVEQGGRPIARWYEGNDAAAEYHEYATGHDISPDCGEDLRAWFAARLLPVDGATPGR